MIISKYFDKAGVVCAAVFAAIVMTTSAAGARTAKDLLIEQQGAGIQVNPGGGQGTLSINGIPNSGVLVLIDGRRFLGKDGNGDLNLEDLLLTGVDRVEVVKGAGSAL